MKKKIYFKYFNWSLTNGHLSTQYLIRGQVLVLESGVRWVVLRGNYTHPSCTATGSSVLVSPKSEGEVEASKNLWSNVNVVTLDFYDFPPSLHLSYLNLIPQYFFSESPLLSLSKAFTLVSKEISTFFSIYILYILYNVYKIMFTLFAPDILSFSPHVLCLYNIELN